jgi:hypothetical protein
METDRTDHQRERANKLSGFNKLSVIIQVIQSHQIERQITHYILPVISRRVS